ncbi:MAG: GAF domain-containing protein [Erysipelotrichales bacterium]|nr:MAG: GAF domain-containing protein [Erysipelotrichales bacterium]
MHEITDRSDDHALFLEQLQAMISDEPDFLANMANMASLIYHTFSALNWVGFYFLKGEYLVLGPFMGKPACTRIRLDQGVCGKAATTREIQNIDDVHKFANHIACDSASNSELVVPMEKNGNILGVLDIDSISFARFSEKDKTTMIQAVHQLLDR